jgi:hypothetical protein
MIGLNNLVSSGLGQFRDVSLIIALLVTPEVTPSRALLGNFFGKKVRLPASLAHFLLFNNQ